MYYRKKHGKGFTYQNEDGKTIRDEDLRSWFESLVIPPAWTDVEISESKRTKVLATGRDDDGRKQYIYNPSYRKRRDKKKYDRIISFAESLEHMRRVTGQHMREEKMTRKKVCATMLRLLDQAFFRPGNSQYAKQNGSYGLTTLRSKHLTVSGKTIEFEYPGKRGKEQIKEIADERLAGIVKELDEMPGYRIFKYIDKDGNKHEVNSEELNAYIQETMGDDFTAKDFRTWAGTMVAAIALDEIGAVQEQDQKQLDKNIRKAIVKVSELLGNTPAVAKDSYIDPRVIESYSKGKTIRFFSDQAEKILEKGNNLKTDEKLVLCLLKEKNN